MNLQFPILLLVGANLRNPFNKYLSEILAIEGYFCVEIQDISSNRFSEDLLKDRIMVILANTPISDDQMLILKSYVAAGGNLIASRPPPEMADLFGVNPVGDYYNVANDCFIAINKADPLMNNFPADILQFFGDAEVYEPSNTRVLAWLSAIPDPHKHSPYAAITLTEHGRGHATLFAYDLGETIVKLHQGRAENASTGPNANADRSNMYKTSSLHIKVLDERQKLLPQADLHQDIVVRLIHAMTAQYLPLIRIWHFPDKQPGVAFIDGDSDGMEQRDLLRVLHLVEHYGACFTVYLMQEHFDQITPDILNRLKTHGHDFGLHPWAGSAKPSLEEMKNALNETCGIFERYFGFRARSTRTHSCIWVGWVDSARYMAANGLRMDTSFVPGRYYQEGFICGSGLPFKFVDEKGEIIDLYEQPTLQGDDANFTAKTLLPPLTQEEVILHSINIINHCIDLYHCVYHSYFHPYSTREEVYGIKVLEEVLRHIQQRGIMTINSKEWIEFNDARRGLEIRLMDINPENGQIIYYVKARKSIDRVTVMIPPMWRGSLRTVRVMGLPVEITHVRWEGGLEWILFTLTLQAGQDVEIMCKYG